MLGKLLLGGAALYGLSRALGSESHIHRDQFDKALSLMKKRAKEFHRELRHAHPVHACAIASSIMDDMISIEEKLRTEFDHMDMQDKASRERQKDIAVRISIGMWDLYGDACSRWPATPRPERWAKMKRR